MGSEVGQRRVELLVDKTYGGKTIRKGTRGLSKATQTRTNHVPHSL